MARAGANKPRALVTLRPRCSGDPGENYYAYDRGNWHVVVLNSMCEEVGGYEATSPIHDVARARPGCQFAGVHARLLPPPLFNSGMHGNQPEMRAT